MAIKFNPFTGNFDLVGSSSSSSSENFSYETIPTSQVVTVPQNQQMFVFHELIVKGEMILNGQVIITT